ncbi:unnamed protein product [Nippostrongylus brasiliensis]|uniref:SCP domain-containing protein n=1 Tax=Nippostrongylus brasiliensis TaxID=27835 RepID=A0A0N4YNW1_NIPBR|nr:unnamed protein product [Nippostrongylus brasiliensis]
MNKYRISPPQEWSCDAEWNMWAGPPYGRYMNLSDINCGGGGSVTSYNDWGTIAQAVPLGGTNQCGTMSTKDVVSGWFQEILPYVTANSLTFNGKGDSFAKFAKWNATQMACVYRPCTDAANAGNQFLYCAFNVKMKVVGGTIIAGPTDIFVRRSSDERKKARLEQLDEASTALVCSRWICVTRKSLWTL